MKGQRLFVLPSTLDDPRVQDFCINNGISDLSRVDAVWLGILAGLTVAIAATIKNQESLQIVHLQVAERMRRKRVARALLGELARFADEAGLNRISVATDCPLRAYFEQVGFRAQGAFLVREREKQR